MPAISDAMAILCLASMSSPLPTAKGRFSATILMERWARAEEMVMEPLEIKASIAWTSTSMPVAAVTLAGMPFVRRGSTTAMSGTSAWLEIIIFLLIAGSVITALAVTSLPVPEVVAIATRGCLWLPISSIPS